MNDNRRAVVIACGVAPRATGPPRHAPPLSGFRRWSIAPRSPGASRPRRSRDRRRSAGSGWTMAGIIVGNAAWRGGLGFSGGRRRPAQPAHLSKSCRGPAVWPAVSTRRASRQQHRPQALRTLDLALDHDRHLPDGLVDRLGVATIRRGPALTKLDQRQRCGGLTDGRQARCRALSLSGRSWQRWSG